MFSKRPNDLQDLIRPVWTGDTVYEESFLPVNEAGDDTDAPLLIPLLYHADEILSVTDMTREHTFEAGRDYVLKDGALLLPAGSTVHKMAWSAYNPAESDKYPFTCKNGGKLFFAEGKELHSREYCVTYRHSDGWDGFVPTCDKNLLPKTRARLLNREPFRFCWFGDSITTGANSSGNPHINVPPYIPMFPELTVHALSARFGCEIGYVNHAVGGTVSGWGCEKLPGDFAKEIPDIMFIGFGMNDASGHVLPETFIGNIRTMAEQTLALNPDCELLFCSTTLPNPLANQFVWDHETHEPLLAALAEEYGAKAALVPITSVHKALLAKKRFFDMTGNNINHPNDFLARVYTQTILTVLCGDLL